jgi:hypothetical protein
LPLVDEKHKWSKKDVQAVHDRLKEICPDNLFAPIPKTWKRSIIETIEATIDIGWCKCTPCEFECADDNFAMEVVLREIAPTVITESESEETESILAEIAGTQVVPAGLVSTFWRLFVDAGFEVIGGSPIEGVDIIGFPTCGSGRASVAFVQLCDPLAADPWVADIRVRKHWGVIVADDATAEERAEAAAVAALMQPFRVLLRGYTCAAVSPDDQEACDFDEDTWSDSQTQPATIVITL